MNVYTAVDSFTTKYPALFYSLSTAYWLSSTAYWLLHSSPDLHVPQFTTSLLLAGYCAVLLPEKKKKNYRFDTLDDIFL